MYTEAALQPCSDPYPKQSLGLLEGVKGQAGLWNKIFSKGAAKQLVSPNKNVKHHNSLNQRARVGVIISMPISLT